MLGSPFHHKSQSSRRNASFQYLQGVYLDCNPVFTIPSMEMGRIVIVVKHRYDNTEESTYLWHVSIYSTPNEILFHPANVEIRRGGNQACQNRGVITPSP